MVASKLKIINPIVMGAFLVKLVFQITIDNHKGLTQFDEQMRWIEADDEQHALSKAETLAQSEEVQFLNKNQNKVVWKFIGLTDLISLEKVQDKALVFGITHETDDEKHFIRNVLDVNKMKVEKLLIPA